MVKKEKNSTINILSGGQSGVDRAALDFALQNHISCGGWCPKGRLAEDGFIDKIYPLKESSSSDPSERTRLNIEEGDGTLIIYLKNMDGGTVYTRDYAKDLKKPLYIINESSVIKPEEFNGWLLANKIKELNIAGPRESKAKGVYNFARMVLGELFLMQLVYDD